MLLFYKRLPLSLRSQEPEIGSIYTPFNLKAFIHDIVMMFLDEHHEMQETFCSGQCTNVERMHPFDLMMYQNADES